MKLYHGTEAELADAILRDGFRVRKVPDAWFGNGIYFWLDRNQAVWWARDQKSYIEPVIISCDLDYNTLNKLDLRIIDDLSRFNEFHEEFHKLVSMFAKKSISTGSSTLNKNEYRCAFCDYLFDNKNIDLIIAQLNPEKQPYISDYLELLKETGLCFPEVQVCLKEKRQDLLFNLKIENIR